jgi:hypothetical protein
VKTRSSILFLTKVIPRKPLSFWWEQLVH